MINPQKMFPSYGVERRLLSEIYPHTDHGRVYIKAYYTNIFTIRLPINISLSQRYSISQL